jgi:hypothetical protein
MCLGGNLLQMYQWILQLQSSCLISILIHKSLKLLVIHQPISTVVPHHKHHLTLPASFQRRLIRILEASPKRSTSISLPLYSRHLHTRIKVIAMEGILKLEINQQINMEANIRTNSHKVTIYHHLNSIGLTILSGKSHSKLILLLWTQMWRSSSSYLFKAKQRKRNPYQSKTILLIIQTLRKLKVLK